MIISMISAMTDKRVIGINNSLPWKLPADMKWFRRHTLGKPVIMGRKTFESFGGKPLPDRTNIVVSRDRTFRPQGALCAPDIETALGLAGDAEEVMIIGGASFYEQMLPQASRLYLTFIHEEIPGDAWFPDFDRSHWREVEHSDCEPDERNAYHYSFTVWERTGS